MKNTDLLHKVSDRFLKIINAISHFINAADNSGRHLVKSALLQVQETVYNIEVSVTS